MAAYANLESFAGETGITLNVRYKHLTAIAVWKLADLQKHFAMAQTPAEMVPAKPYFHTPAPIPATQCPTCGGHSPTSYGGCPRCDNLA